MQQQQIQYQDRQKLFNRIAPIYDQVIMTTALYDLEQLACLSVQVIQLLSRPLLCSQTFALTLQFNDILSLGQHRVWKRMAVKWCGASTGQYVLDVCCGSGDLAFRLAEAVGPAGQVIFLILYAARLHLVWHSVIKLM